MDAKKYFTIMTYQSLEKKRIQNPTQNMLWGYDYVICDEAHYFLKDALFNTSTCASYSHVLGCYGSATLIFMSATIDKVKREIEKGANNWIEKSVSEKILQGIINACDYCYSSEKNYGYIDIKSFKDREEISDIIINGEAKDKWWIFINDIMYGKHLEKILKKNNIDAIFVDSKYEQDFEKNDTVAYLVENQLMKHRIIIATSALDNGISIHDEELRKMIILAESEEDLIQMLGRKRRDNKRISLYLCLGSKANFERRLATLKQTSSIYEKKFKNNDLQNVLESLLASPFCYKHARKFLLT